MVKILQAGKQASASHMELCMPLHRTRLRQVQFPSECKCLRSFEAKLPAHVLRMGINMRRSRRGTSWRTG